MTALTSLSPFTMENTQGYSAKDLLIMNQIYQHRVSLLDEQQQENENLLQWIQEQILDDYDRASEYIPDAVFIVDSGEVLPVFEILDVKIIPSEKQGADFIATLILVSLEDKDEILPGILMVIYPSGIGVIQRDLQSITSTIPDDLSEVDWPFNTVICEDGWIASVFPRPGRDDLNNFF